MMRLRKFTNKASIGNMMSRKNSASVEDLRSEYEAKMEQQMARWIATSEQELSLLKQMQAHILHIEQSNELLMLENAMLKLQLAAEKASRDTQNTANTVVLDSHAPISIIHTTPYNNKFTNTKKKLKSGLSGVFHPMFKSPVVVVEPMRPPRTTHSMASKVAHKLRRSVSLATQ